MLRALKLRTLRGLRNCGVFELCAGSGWRRERLLILCYHGVSLLDEHLWCPGLYMSADDFASRLERIRIGGYNVLPLGEALKQLQARDLPPRSVVITFDDGLYDFYARAWPLLMRNSYPATVYLTTYYSEYNRPIFRLICDYMMWQKRGSVVDKTIDLRTSESRAREMKKLDDYVAQHKLSGRDKDQFAMDLAKRLGIDWDAILSNRILHIMNPEEASQLSRAGIDLQLHTHRHRTPTDEASFRRELDDNAVRLRAITGHAPTHFCYPSGIHYPDYPDWLRKWGAASAVTCEAGLARAGDDAMLLPRVCDYTGVTEVEFEAWLSGAMRWMPKRRTNANREEPHPEP